MAIFTREEALDYHSKPRPGKLEVVPIKAFNDQKDLSMAYSPGVAQACLEIAADQDKANLYTGRANLVAVVSNGTAVLGLGNIGPLAGKPVMEGKGVLFKSFADIDVYDIDLDCKDPDELINVVKCLEPTFGGINLEDIKAPECFYIEDRLKELMNVPVFHDDQHGTAIISGAALQNACEITGKKIGDLKIVVVGAGAAGIACTRFYVAMGAKRENICMFDSKGLIYRGRAGVNKYKEEFAQPDNKGDLAACMKGADVFLGLSKKGLVSKDMVRSMADSPVIFAMANPDPEITFEDAKDARPDAIIGTGRSDYPNQINNVSGFPYIFRGALDAGATDINEAMKLAASRALADLAKKPIPQEVLDAYGLKEAPAFGRDYVLPKPLDPRILTSLAPAVAKAAMDTGVAVRPIADLDAYAGSLKKRIDAYRARVRPYVEALASAAR
ncbi:MAG: malate dehydrogenase [Desulfovibrio sp.]|nr:malate dehydrogenase [Desulfovibrio sp.]